MRPCAGTGVLPLPLPVLALLDGDTDGAKVDDAAPADVAGF